jgi:hypothetical protein
MPSSASTGSHVTAVTADSIRIAARAYRAACAVSEALYSSVARHV